MPRTFAALVTAVTARARRLCDPVIRSSDMRRGRWSRDRVRVEPGSGRMPRRDLAMSKPGSIDVGLTGNQDIDGILWGTKWDTTTLTFTVPETADVYGYDSITGF